MKSYKDVVVWDYKSKKGEVISQIACTNTVKKKKKKKKSRIKKKE